MKIESVGVIGGGIMGQGISQDLAQTGHKVILVDVSQEILDETKSKIKTNIRLLGLFKSAIEAFNVEEILHSIHFTTDIHSLQHVDFIIENVPEKLDVKKEVFKKLDCICPAGCIFASDTSAIPISRIASWVNRPEKIIGTHFMNPTPMTKMVEVIRGPDTSDDTIEVTKKLLTQMGKDFVIVGDSPGFVTNRVLMLTINEAIFLLEEEKVNAENIDKIFRSCFGHKMGPLETADLIGLDTVLDTLNILYEYLPDHKFAPCGLLKEMVDAGLYGRKSGKGFYQYPVDE